MYSRSIARPDLLLTLVATFLLWGHAAAREGRPYFMPKRKRDEIHQLIREHDWAKADYARIKQEAAKGNGYWAAFLYALDGNAAQLATARKWLVGWAKGGGVSRHRKLLNTPGYFKAGHPWLGDVYYDLNVSHIVGYDWICAGLDEESRKTIADGLTVEARYRQKSMDRWTQTPNLVFKPTFMVAMAGLATQNRELVDWGFHREPGSSTGGYLEAMDVMLRDGGPWHEAPIYPIAHTDLWCMAQLSFCRQLHDGRDWFAHRTPNGGSAKGLMDYYLDTAYPIERTGHGPGQIRIATYGDGATGPGGSDMFLVNPAGPGWHVTEALKACYRVSGDPRYAPFVAMIPGYKPSLWERRPLPETTVFPAAPSRIWPSYGLAMLRSDESPDYWTSGKAIAVFQLMTQSYGHQHLDKFSIMMHGAGRLLYPDYNAIQYENPAHGWTRHTVSHNTMLVDECDTSVVADPTIRHEFSPEVKFLATSASGVFEGVEQTRALLLTREYLLDVFHASSKVPHTYDYVLHSLGQPRPPMLKLFQPSERPSRRYWVMAETWRMASGNPWWMDFVIEERPGDRKGKYGEEWYAHRAAVRLAAAAANDTEVYVGVWGEELAKLVGQRHRGAGMDRLGMLVVRRRNVRDTAFVVAHEPFANDEEPQIRVINAESQTENAILVRVSAKDFTDYIAVALGAQEGRPEHVLSAPLVADTVGHGSATFAFRNYGYLRVSRDGKILVRRGGWTGFRFPRAFRLPAFGSVPEPKPVRRKPEIECPLPITVSPDLVRLSEGATREVRLSIQNVLKDSASGHIELDLPAGIAVQPDRSNFRPLAPGREARVKFAIHASADATAGLHTIPYRLVYRVGGVAEVRTRHLPLKVSVGPTLKYVYPPQGRPYYAVAAPLYTAQLDMFHGMPRFLADDDGTVRLRDAPLFTFTDGEKPMLFEHTPHAYTWAERVPAALKAHTLDRCKYLIRFEDDRLTVTMDDKWTRPERTHFTVPGKWASPGGPPRWMQIIALDASGKQVDVRPGTELRVVAAELAFPDSSWRLAFSFKPAQQVTFTETGMTFSIGSLTGDAWSVGFCRPGRLGDWLGRGLPRVYRHPMR